MIVFSAGIVGWYDFSFLDEGVIFAQDVAVVAADVRVDAAYPSHLCPATGTLDIGRSLSPSLAFLEDVRRFWSG